MALSPETQALLNQWAALCDTDTAGTAAPALSAGSDSNGVGYNVGDLVVTFPDGTRACIPAKLEPTDDTFGTVVVAAEAGTDTGGVDYAAGDLTIVFPDGTIACIPPKITFEDTDTFGTVAPAAEAGTDSGGNVYEAGALVATFPDGTTACIAKDTFATASTAATAGSDSFGQGYNVGDTLILLPDGQTVCIPSKQVAAEDTFSTSATATEAGADSYGNVYEIGATILTLPSGETICIPEKITFVDTDTSGTVGPAAADGTDSNGVTYLAGDTLIVFPDGTTAAIPAAVDTFATIDPAPADGTDDFGNDFLAGATILTLADGRIVCIPPKSDPTVDTFGTSAAAINAGSDSYGNGFNVGDIVITLADGTRVCIPPKVTDTDTFGTVAEATEAGVDSFGNAYEIGAEVITFADGSTLCSAKSVPEQELYKAGDTLPDDMVGTIEIVLNDGNKVVLSAGDLVPANSASSVIVDEVTGAPECISKSIVDQDLYKPGDTLPADMVGTIDILLDDGTFATLAAGDPIPVDSASDVYVDESTGEASCISKSAPPEAELYEPGDTLPADMAAPIDIVLDDGSIITLNAGEVVPANSASDVFVDEVTGKAACISKYTPDQDLFNPGDTLPADMVGTVDVILEDGTPVTLAAGDVVPATSTGAVYVDEVTGAPRCIGAKLTKEQIVADFPAGICDPATPVEVLTAACEKLNIKDLIPVCIVTECEFAGELGSVGSVPAPVLDLQMTEVQTGQSGFLVAGSPDSFIDAPVDVSPTFTINPDCVYSLQVTYGGNSNPLPCSPTLNISGATGLSAPRQLTYDKGVQANGTSTTYSVKESIYLFDGASGVAPTIDLDFLQLGGATSVVSYSWAEICDTTGEVVRSNYFSAPICSDSNILTGDTDGPYDLGGCDSLIFSSGRHVAYNPDGGFATEGADTDWFQHSLDGAGFTTAYEWTSLNHPSACQLGHLGGILDANSGSWTWDSTANNLDTQHGAVMTATTLNCENAGDGLQDSAESCSVDSENTNCLCDAMIECVFKGSVKLCAEEGTTLTAVPVINGIAQTTQAVSASDGQCIDHQIESSFLDTSLILPPGGVYTSTASWQFTGTGSYETTDTKLTCKVIPS